MRHHLDDYGVGSIAEIFDGEAPFVPRGCPAQAWSVAETLRPGTRRPGGRRRAAHAVVRPVPASHHPSRLSCQALLPCCSRSAL